MEEIWRNIEGYENYQVSNYGRIKSLNYNHTGEEDIMTPSITGNGHLHIILSKNRSHKYPLVHILVAKHFIPNPENKPIVHHIDHNPTNNHVDNLMWVTQKQHADLHPERYKYSANICSIPILQYTLDGQTLIKEYPSAMEASRHSGVNRGNINSCCSKKRKSAGGFIWRYKNEGN